jgi:predicted CXXCH cytochrome family protein
MTRTWLHRLLAAALFAAPVALLGIPFGGRSQTAYLPGPTSNGHHQIEEKCAACHVRFDGATEEGCLRCHGQALRDAEDSHAPGKFDDPGKAAQLAVVDARSCIPCHREHRPEARERGSLTMAATLCAGCHAQVGSERPSHRSFGPESCASAGCHNYHDNRALYRDFLVRHRDDPALLAEPRVPVKSAAGDPSAGPPPDAPELIADEPGYAQAVVDWNASAHARGKINCTGCHQQKAGPAEPRWQNAVSDSTCAGCHEDQRSGWLAGKHGMRVASGLTAMVPARARLAMRSDAPAGELGCTSCHGAHRFDRRWAAVASCLRCHDDAHSRAYQGSAHELAWQRELTGEAPAGSGVSCATCHLPRRRKGDGIAVEHDQNANLRPGDRMLRGVCLSCHGAGFALAALADPALVRTNFTGPPAPTVRTGMDLVREGATNAK